MPRHEFRPGRAVTGLVMLALAAGYTADAAELWDAPPQFFVAVLCGGLATAACVTLIGYRIRRRRAARSASRENDGAPASSSGSHAMR
ncbi:MULTISPECIES: hypothetical protein [unclassified Streptomyces]|uniref:hypothetical protein n=1 Tax=unclassified Streptomyces TaxID=2593676 RepID=UPI000DAB5C0C|nr:MULTISPECIES: hypothetical protein [unclassified Streptomyces]PZT76197.1 hypothetical protein DNK56_22810 [Streptomyces sp. AC1-42W]PZT79850.1 hypothetical protein DNK55_09880 [Streptomyces sp. AC1-42T]WUC95510.1 hypothetical protein OG710_18800 [Streptomyces sp. NBC_00525]